MAKKHLVLIAVFLVTGLFVYGWHRTVHLVTKPDISSFLQQIGPYRSIRQIRLSKELEDMLDLDTYLFADYFAGDSKINLYIGYYFSSGKAYAAHSPLVCYPSQGWKVEQGPVRQSLQVGKYVVNYEEIITSLGGSRELVVYWYQAGVFTNNEVYRNKIDMAYNKLIHDSEEHAFVRVTVTMGDKTYQQAEQEIRHFLEIFFPKFLVFINASDATPGS